MYDLLLAGILLSVTHVALSFAAIHVMKADYKTYLAITTGSGLLLAILLRFVASSWKLRLSAVFKEEWVDGELPLDILGFFVALIVGGVASAVLVYRRYGVAGWAGSVAANGLASYLL